MHHYKIEIYAYKPNGSIGSLVTTRYADNPEHARLICAEYDSQMQMDEQGNPTTMKAYKVNLYILAYKAVADKTAFFAQFTA